MKEQRDLQRTLQEKHPHLKSRKHNDFKRVWNIPSSKIKTFDI